MVENGPVSKHFAIDVEDFSRFLPGREAPVWWAIVGLILIEMAVVSAFVMSYFYLQMQHDPWPPAETPVPDVVLPTWSLIVMLSSCFTMYRAGRAINKDRVRAFYLYTFASVGLACVVLLIRWQKFEKLEFRWDENVYGSFVWTLSGFHFIHVVSAAIGTLVIAVLGTLGYFNKKRQIGVVVDTLYWNFVAIAWIPFYLALYWAPRWFG